MFLSLKVGQNMMTGTVMVVANEKSIKWYQVAYFFKFIYIISLNIIFLKSTRLSWFNIIVFQKGNE